MSTDFQSCPKCQCFILSDTYECPECGYVLDEQRARNSQASSPAGDMKNLQMYDTCSGCGESVRTGLVRCWNCNRFMRADVEARYREMTSTPQHIIFSDIPADQRTELISNRDKEASTPWAAVFDADDDASEFSLRDSGTQTDSKPTTTGDDDFELDSPQMPQRDQPAAPAEDTPVADQSDAAAEKTPESETPKSKKKPVAKPKESGEFDDDDLVGIAMQDQKETNRKKRQKIQEARKQRILMPCSCGAWIRVHQDQAGRVVRCRQCKAPVVVPVMKKKGKEGGKKKEKKVAIKVTWLKDVRLHLIQPTDVVLKPGSLEKTVETVDVVFHESGLHLIKYAPPAKKSLFNRNVDGPPAVDEQRKQASEHIEKTGKIANLPFGELQTVSAEQASKIRLIQPVREAHESMFAGVPVFGEGQIAVYVPLVLLDNQQAFCSFPLSIARRFISLLSSLFHVDIPIVENGAPAAEEFDTLKCHFSEMPVRSLKNVVYYENDPGFELELAGYICGTCGIALTEDARAKKKLGGAAGKGIAKAKCPKCSNKFGDLKAWNLTKTPDDENSVEEEEDVSEVLKPRAANPDSKKRNSGPATEKDLQGKWKLTSLGKNGNFAEPDDMSAANIIFVVEGEMYSVMAGDEFVEKGTLTIDVDQNPAQLDQNISEGPDAGKAHLGIFRIVEGKLENCQGAIDQARPTSFDSKDNATASLAVFERLS